jgi:hypothetical protein
MFGCHVMRAGGPFCTIGAGTASAEADHRGGRRGLTTSSSSKRGNLSLPRFTFPASEGPLKMATLLETSGNEDHVLAYGAAESRAAVATAFNDVAVESPVKVLSKSCQPISLARCESYGCQRKQAATRIKSSHMAQPRAAPSSPRRSTTSPSKVLSKSCQSPVSRSRSV